jgi:hypothetical protein
MLTVERVDSFLGGAGMTSYFDSDIDNLELSEVEKHGLQGHRNYTKSLTEQRQKEFVTYINAKLFDPAPLEKLLQKILQEDPRFLPVITCAFADDELKTLFSEAIRPGVPGGKSASRLGVILATARSKG